MISLLGCCRLPWRGSGYSLSCDMLIPVTLQPVLVLILGHYSHDSIIIVSALSAVILLIFIILTKYDSRSQILYYWIASSITYVIVVFENIVVPLSEIEFQENFFLILFTALALIFLYLTKNVPDQVNRPGSSLSNGILTESCPICRVKISPRSYHCRICQSCVAKYDYHCYWLNSCIGESNQHFFVFGVIFSALALGYASLLILTTICQPELILGVLLPKDCTAVSATFGMFTCFTCGIYCMELAVLLLLQLIQQLWLISRGYSALEWKEQYKYSICRSSPYSRGFLGNWKQFFKNLKRINF